jgi:hypothetical protein
MYGMPKAAGKKRESFLHYLPYSAEDEKLGMVCTSAGSIEVPENTVYPPLKNSHPLLFRQVATGRTLPEFQIVYIEKGRGSFVTGGRTYTVSPGSLLLLLPGMWHRYKPDFGTGWHEFWVGFKGPFFTRMMEEGLISADHVFFEIGLRDSISAIFDRIFDEVSVQRPLYQLKACASVLSLIAETLTIERRREQPNRFQNPACSGATSPAGAAKGSRG